MNMPSENEKLRDASNYAFKNHFLHQMVHRKELSNAQLNDIFRIMGYDPGLLFVCNMKGYGLIMVDFDNLK
jgi:hypothetical protein